MAEHCRACSSCQRVSRQGGPEAPLVPLPIMDQPFKRIAMGIVGPHRLPENCSGYHQYVLVICDYASRFPEAKELGSSNRSRKADGRLCQIRYPGGDPHRPGNQLHLPAATRAIPIVWHSRYQNDPLPSPDRWLNASTDCC